jgi:hypothetical protein
MNYSLKRHPRIAADQNFQVWLLRLCFPYFVMVKENQHQYIFFLKNPCPKILDTAELTDHEFSFLSNIGCHSGLFLRFCLLRSGPDFMVER